MLFLFIIIIIVIGIYLLVLKFMYLLKHFVSLLLIKVPLTFNVKFIELSLQVLIPLSSERLELSLIPLLIIEVKERHK